VIPRSGIREVFDLARGVPDLVHLELGEPDFRIPDHVAEASIQAIKEGFTKYTPNAGLEELREAISEKVKRENGFDADSKTEVMVTAGAMNALSFDSINHQSGR
jgi:aminotransferase